MRKVELFWSNPWPVCYLLERLKPEDHYKTPIPEMQNYGVYMYLDNTGQARYIGQAYNNSKIALQKRIRWEVVKDGEGGATSAFFQLCEESKVDRLNLQVKVAYLKNPQYDGVEIDRFINAIEKALIFDRAQAGDPLMNKSGKRRYRLGSIEIINSGNYAPLPDCIIL